MVHVDISWHVFLGVKAISILDLLRAYNLILFLFYPRCFYFLLKMCTSFSDLCVYICAFWSALQVLCHGMATKHCTSIKRWTEHQCPCIKNSQLERWSICFVLRVKTDVSCAAVLMNCSFHVNSIHFFYAYRKKLHIYFMNTFLYIVIVLF